MKLYKNSVRMLKRRPLRSLCVSVSYYRKEIGDVINAYDKWRYGFPEFDTTQIWGKVPSKQLSDALVDAFKDKLKE